MLNAKLSLKIIVVAILIAGLLVSTTFSSLTSTSVISNSATILQASDLVLTVDGFNLLDPAGNKVYLRGVGIAGMAPDLIFWGTGEGDSWAHQWTAANDSDVLQTFKNLRDVWHVNMIRFFIYPEWWWVDEITPSVASGSGFSTTPVSTRDYVKTLASAAASYGIYLDIVPYALTAQPAAFASDPYLSSNFGLPMMNQWDDAQTAFIQSTGYSEQQFWSEFWSSMATELGAYSNVIFEAWNEPDSTAPEYTSTVPSGYLSYLTTMYNAIRGTGAENLIMYQWRVGWMPNGWGMDLSWASQIANAIGNPSNVVYTTHFYYYSPSDITQYWNQNGLSNGAGGVPMTVSQFETTLNALINGGTDSKNRTYTGMGVNAPLVINEEGDCMYYTANAANDYVWWANLLQAQANLGIGTCAYYWLSDNGLGPAYSKLTLLSSGYSPNTMGQEYIDIYSSLLNPNP